MKDIDEEDLLKKSEFEMVFAVAILFFLVMLTLFGIFALEIINELKPLWK